MNSTSLHSQDVPELKSLAKAVGASLKRQGHAVPHSALLNALAAAGNKRDWHKLLASARSQPAVPPASTPVATPAIFALPKYSSETWFLLRLAQALDRPVYQLTANEQETLDTVWARLEERSVDGVLSWSGWNVPATLNLRRFTLDAGDFRPDTTAESALFQFRLPGLHDKIALKHITFAKDSLAAQLATPAKRERAQNDKTWIVPLAAYEQLRDYLKTRISRDAILKSAGWVVPKYEGPEVEAEVHTDDRVMQTTFDARPYLQQASDDQLLGILQVGFSGDYCTDDIALYARDHALDPDVVEIFAYLNAVQRGKTMGFECSVDPKDYLRWLDQVRPTPLARYACENEGVSVAEGPLDEKGNPSWSWSYQGETKAWFPSREGAWLDAYHRLGGLRYALRTYG